MKAIILSHAKVPDDADQCELHRFGYCIGDGTNVLHSDSLSLRTALVLVAELRSGSALLKMCRRIVECDPLDYDQLIGQSFSDTSSAQRGAPSA
jgi:hypothetical protein